jgi:hypothetical protein
MLITALEQLTAALTALASVTTLGAYLLAFLALVTVVGLIVLVLELRQMRTALVLLGQILERVEASNEHIAAMSRDVLNRLP